MSFTGNGDHNHWIEQPDTIEFKGETVEFINELVYVGEGQTEEDAINSCVAFDSERSPRYVSINQRRRMMEIVEATYNAGTIHLSQEDALALVEALENDGIAPEPTEKLKAAVKRHAEMIK